MHVFDAKDTQETFLFFHEILKHKHAYEYAGLNPFHSD